MLEIDKDLNGKKAIKSNNLWFEDDGKNFEYYKDNRIGILYASKKDQERLWRFVIKNDKNLEK